MNESYTLGSLPDGGNDDPGLFNDWRDFSLLLRFHGRSQFGD